MIIISYFLDHRSLEMAYSVQYCNLHISLHITYTYSYHLSSTPSVVTSRSYISSSFDILTPDITHICSELFTSSSNVLFHSLVHSLVDPVSCPRWFRLIGWTLSWHFSEFLFHSFPGWNCSFLLSEVIT